MNQQAQNQQIEEEQFIILNQCALVHIENFKKRQIIDTDYKKEVQWLNFIQGQGMLLNIIREAANLYRKNQIVSFIVSINALNLFRGFQSLQYLQQIRLLQNKPQQKISETARQKFLRFNILRAIADIQLTNLTILNLFHCNLTNIEEISWLKAPELKQLAVGGDVVLSIKTLCKIQFKKLQKLVINLLSNGQTDIRITSRIKLPKKHLKQINLYAQQKTHCMNYRSRQQQLLSSDLYNIKIDAKLQFSQFMSPPQTSYELITVKPQKTLMCRKKPNNPTVRQTFQQKRLRMRTKQANFQRYKRNQF